VRKRLARISLATEGENANQKSSFEVIETTNPGGEGKERGRSYLLRRKGDLHFDYQRKKSEKRIIEKTHLIKKNINGSYGDTLDKSKDCGSVTKFHS